MQGCKKFIVGLMVVAVAGVAAADEIDDLRDTVKGLNQRLKTLEKKQQAQEKYNENFLNFMKQEREAGRAMGENDFRAYWDKGLRFESGNGQFKLKLGGRIQVDMGWIDDTGIESDTDENLEDGTEFRRLRLYASGSIYNNVGYKLQVDFAGVQGGGEVDIKDAYIQVKKLPVVGTLTVGHYVQPFSLEQITSSKYLEFLERGLPTTFAPDRQVGIMLNNSLLDKKLNWYVSVYRLTSPEGGRDESDGGYNLASRVTYVPWFENKGEKLIHLGVAYNLQYAEDAYGDTALNAGNVRFRARPEYHNTERLIDTGTFNHVEWINMIGAEAIFHHGPFWAQGEYIGVWAEEDSPTGTTAYDHNFCGWYISAGYFLTGEHRSYKLGKGVGRLSPKQNFGEDGGWGAWEVTMRYSMLDLDDGDGLPDSAGTMHDATVGVNWYLNPNTKIQFNYIRACVDSRDTSNAADIFAIRFALDF